MSIREQKDLEQTISAINEAAAQPQKIKDGESEIVNRSIGETERSHRRANSRLQRLRGGRGRAMAMNTTVDRNL